MTKALILAASLGLSVSAVHACDFIRSTQISQKVDSTMVASVTAGETVPTPVPDARVAPSHKAAPVQQPASPVAD